MRAPAVVYGMVTLSLLGCESSLDLGQRQSASAIVGGSSDSGDLAVVALFAQQPNATSGSLCTASLISPNLLVTAAHCVAPSEVGPNAEFAVFVGGMVNASATTLRVKETHFDTAFDINHPENGHDIGIVVLSADSTIAPLPYNQTPLTAATASDSVRIVGFGLLDGTAQTGAGTKRTATTVITEIDPLLIGVGLTGTQTCNGDSGGPALVQINGVETIIGVTSFGDQTCTMGGFDTRIDLYSSFIAQYLPACVPQCSGKTCGADGCAGTCGTCNSSDTCSSAGACISASGGGSIGVTPGSSTAPPPVDGIVQPGDGAPQNSLTSGGVGGASCRCVELPAPAGPIAALWSLLLLAAVGVDCFRRSVRRLGRRERVSPPTPHRDMRYECLDTSE